MPRQCMWISLGLSCLLAATALGQTCSVDYPAATPSFDTVFSLSGQTVSGSNYAYFYYSGTADTTITITVISTSQDLDLYISYASDTLTPTSGNSYYSGTSGSNIEVKTITPTSTGCLAIGVKSFTGNSDTFSIAVILGTPAPTTAPPTYAPTPYTFTTPAPTVDDLTISRCELELGSAAFDRPLLTGDFVETSDTVSAGSYKYFYYSTDRFQEIVIFLYANSSSGDVDLYFSRTDGYTTSPTSTWYSYRSAQVGNKNETIYEYTSGRECFAIGVYGNTTTSFVLRVTSEDNITSPSRLALYIGLGVGIPIFVCCIIPLSIGGACYYWRKKKVFTTTGPSGTAF